ELLAEANGVRRVDRGERRVQFRAVQRHVGRAEALLDLGAHRVQIADRGRIPLAIVADLGRKADVANAPFEPEPAQDLHGIGVHLDGGADAGEGGRLLVDARVDPDPAKGPGRRQPGDAGADDGDLRRARHGDQLPLTPTALAILPLRRNSRSIMRANAAWSSGMGSTPSRASLSFRAGLCSTSAVSP